MKKIALLFAYVLNTVFVFAQYDSIKNSFQKEFSSFKQGIIEEHKGFINKNDSIFIQFIDGSWDTFNSFYSREKPEPKPSAQPRISHDSIEKLEIRSFDLKVPEPELINHPKEQPPLKMNVPDKDSAGAIVLDVDFYGIIEKIFHKPFTKKCEFPINQKGATLFYKEAATSGSLHFTLEDIKRIKEDRFLNDWAYYQLLKKSANLLYNDINKQVLFTWFAMLQSGYNVKLGFVGNKSYILVPSDVVVYSTLYLELNGINYYAIDYDTNNGNNPKIITHKTDYPDSRKYFSFAVDRLPILGNDITERMLSFRDSVIQIKLNKNYIDFYKTYPHCELNIYFGTPLSCTAFKSLDKYLKPMFLGMGEPRIVSILLDFVQHSIAYGTDDEQFGKERYLFAEESFFYPFSDCEDRSILMARLVERYTNLKSIGLDYPGHVSLAVEQPETTKGTFIRYNNKKFVICDPTYINAGIGMLPPELNKFKPEIVIF